MRWPALDVLRGIAVVCMLANHATARLLSGDALSSGITGVLFFVGSFAPVLFFFATGIGYGLSHQVGKKGNTKDVLVKASILILADVFMRGGDFSVIGWDFLAFIAFSMLMLHYLRGRSYSILLALILIILLIVIRFVFVFIYKFFVPDSEQSVLILRSLGGKGFPGISYWFTPWLVYPLVGFLLGVWLKKNSLFYTRRVIPLCLVTWLVGAGVLILSFILVLKGAGIFRWGSVSANFFIASLSSMMLSLGLSCLIADVWKNVRLTQLISLRGVSSLAVVPIHYFILYLIRRYCGIEISVEIFLVAFLPWVMLCFLLAKSTDRLAKWMAKASSDLYWVGILGLVAICVLMTVSFHGNQWLFFNDHMAQYFLCLLLGFSYSGRKNDVSTGVTGSVSR